MSLPVRERGLKYHTKVLKWLICSVAPRAGAWIEIIHNLTIAHYISVAPRAGAWIEITQTFKIAVGMQSLPVRERGLKYWYVACKVNIDLSLPVRERGLK